MTTLKIYHINAFASGPFAGNPAAVIPLDFWLSDHLMQNLAAQNNLSETAFFVKTTEGYHIRWFTPKTEVDLCGHATLASAFVIFEILGFQADAIVFDSKSGPLFVSKNEDFICLNFPVATCEPQTHLDGIFEAIGEHKIEIYKAVDDYLLVFDSEETVTNLAPDFGLMSKINARGVIVTAKSSKYDFVSRFFGPKVGINEDPVTGSAFTKLIPFWAERLQKTKMSACQISDRRGEVSCELLGERVLIGGKANLYLQGEVFF